MTLISTGEKPTEHRFISLSLKEKLHLTFEQCDRVQEAGDGGVILTVHMLDSESEITLC